MGGCQQLCCFPPPPGSPPPATAKSPPPPSPPTRAPNFRPHCKHVEGQHAEPQREGPLSGPWGEGTPPVRRVPRRVPRAETSCCTTVGPDWVRHSTHYHHSPGRRRAPHTPRYRLPGRHTPRSLPGGSFKAPPPSVLNHHRGSERLPPARRPAPRPAPLPCTTLVSVHGPCAGV